MEELDLTRKFSLGDQRDMEIKAILSTVYQALQERAITPSIRSSGTSCLRTPPTLPTTTMPGP